MEEDIKKMFDFGGCTLLGILLIAGSFVNIRKLKEKRNKALPWKNVHTPSSL
jgi:hypothetical protein